MSNKAIYALFWAARALLAGLTAAGSLSYAAGSSDITVTVAPHVEKEFAMAVGHNKKKVAGAVSTSRRFLQYRFTNHDEYDVETHDRWMRDIQPLITISPAQWEEMYQQWARTETIGNARSGVLLTCPTVRLVDMQLTDRAIRLSYETQIVGLSIGLWSPLPYELDTQRKGDIYRIEITLANSGKIIALATSEPTVAMSSRYHLSNLKRVRDISSAQHNSQATAGYDSLIAAVAEASDACAKGGL